VLLEPLLRQTLEAHGESVQVDFGYRFEHFEEQQGGVLSTVVNVTTGERKQIFSQYLVGCDGANSTVRRQLGYDWDVMDTRTGPLSAIKNKYGFGAAASALVRTAIKRAPRLPDGRVYMIHFKSKDLGLFHRNGVFWHEQCAQTGDTLIAQDDKDTWTLHVVLDSSMDTKKLEPKAFLFERFGRSFDCQVLEANEWRPGLTIATKFGRDRVWLAGDACHQVIPTGGYGMNTGVGEAVTLGWMLAATLQGWGGQNLLAAYEPERKPVIEANRQGSALNAGVRLMVNAHACANTRRTAAYIAKLGNLENEAFGLEVDYRYTDSPVICHEASPPPPWRADAITPSTYPGSRLPHIWLAPGVSVFDKLGQNFTLIRTKRDANVRTFERDAAQLGVPLKVLDVTDANAVRVFGAPLILVRPDQHVAWRGSSAPPDALKVLKKVTGHA